MSDECVEVVSAAIVQEIGDGKRILLGRRAGASHEGKWCTPGGKVDPGETHEQALRRELREELGELATVDFVGKAGEPVVVYVFEGRMTTQDRPYRLTCYLVRPHRGARFKAVEGHGLDWAVWMKPEHLRGSGLAPADAANVDALFTLLGEERVPSDLAHQENLTRSEWWPIKPPRR